MSEVKFEREPRYLVIKLSKLDGGYASGSIYPNAKLAKKIEDLARGALVDCVVVEADWPEYEPVWEMIERRMAGYPSPESQRLRADTAETELAIWKTKACEAADRHIAAEQRIVGLLDLQKNCTDCVRNGEDFDLPVTTMARIDAALNPNPEAESHE